ncbi:hypothetical protein LDENG_00091040 [Lucifuga dentata]|nr:hypothetical protein LDENG_00091040 [Lucifuga dentata]
MTPHPSPSRSYSRIESFASMTVLCLFIPPTRNCFNQLWFRLTSGVPWQARLTCVPQNDQNNLIEPITILYNCQNTGDLREKLPNGRGRERGKYRRNPGKREC